MNYLAEFGMEMWANGYTVIPIYPFDSPKKGAGKRPIGEDWQKTINSKEELEEWARKYPNAGVGILTAHTPAVDVDVYDQAASDHMAEWITEHLGESPCRVGRAPKKLFLFYARSKFGKVKSCVWEDDLGQNHAVEVLADGQQFVSFGVHPETKQPYEWVSGGSPLVNAAEIDLEEIDLEKARAVAAEFDRYAESQGWVKVKRGINGAETSDWADDDDWAAMSDVKKWDGSYEELREIVMKYPNPEDYETWVRLLAAMQVSCRDQEAAREIAREWSAQAPNFDEADFEYKWEKGFTHNAGSLVTLGSVISVVREIEKSEEAAKQVQYTDAFSSCDSVTDWNSWAESFKKERVFGLARRTIVEVAAAKYQQLTGVRMTQGDKKSSLGYDHGSKSMPEWLKDFVFCQANDVFVRKSSGNSMKKGAFDTSHARFCAFEDDSFTPTHYASVIHPVPVAWDSMYYPAMHGDMPGTKWRPDDSLMGPEFFKDERGAVWLNTFDPESLPEPAESLSKYDKKAIEVIKDYLVVLFPNDKERVYVMDWLAWIIQNPTKRINYALLIRGAHGSGKSALGMLMAKMLGQPNVGWVSNSVMNGRFTDWAEGDILKIIEEVYDREDRWGAVERQKEYITNDLFQVEGKGVKAKMVVNTSSKMMFTNHVNALPLDENQRRYLVVSTQAESKADMERVYGSASERSRFFKGVYRAIENHGPALKRMFMDYKISESFDPKGHAPQDTSAFSEMVAASGDETEAFIASLLETPTYAGVSHDVVFMPGLRDAFVDAGEELPRNLRLKNVMMALGFRSGGQMKYDGQNGRVFVRKRVRAAWIEDGKADTTYARDQLKKLEDALGGPKKEDPFDDEV